MNELALFAGGGGGLYASLLLGHTTVCAVEIEPANRRMLLQRQIDGVFPRFPIWDDVRTFDGNPWRGCVDVVSGGFPCQDISSAGRGKGIDGERSGLWVEMARIIREVQPEYAFVENSPMLTSRGLHRVLGDLAEMGFDARWGVLGAAHVGAPHLRERIWILAHHQRCDSMADPGSGRCSRQGEGKIQFARRTQTECASKDFSDTTRVTKREQTNKTVTVAISGPSRDESIDCSQFMADAESQRCREARELRCQQSEERSTGGSEALCDTYGNGRDKGRDGDYGEHVRAILAAANRWPAEPGVCRVVNGVADWKHRIFALGNGQVPRVAAAAWRMLNRDR